MVDVEKLLSSKGRLRILRLLFSEGQANISRIIKETGLHYRLVTKHLEELKSMGIVVEKKYGRLRIFEVDLTDPRNSALKELLDRLERL